MSAPRRAVPRAAWSAAAAVVVAAAGLVVLAVAVESDGDDGATPDPTTTVTGASPTTVVRLASLTTGVEEAVLFRWADQEIATDEVRAVTEDSRVPAEFPVVLDPDFLSAQGAEGIGTERLERQLRHIANRLGPLGAEPGRPPLAVVSRPTPDGGSLATPVLVFQPGPAPRTIQYFDLRLIGEDGRALTARTRFLEAADPEVPAGSAYFNVVMFAPEQVLDLPREGEPLSYEADVVWREEPVR